MKFWHLLLILFIAGAAGYGGASLAPIASNAIKTETAYERVIRTGVLRCGYGLWPGSTERDPNTGQLSGITVQLAEELGRKLDLKIEWVEEFLWGNQVQVLASGKVDALCTSDGPWVYTSAKYVDYVYPYAYFPIYIVIRSNDRRFTTLADFNQPSVRFAAVDGDISAQMRKDFFPQASSHDVAQITGAASIVQDLVDGKADAAFLDQITINKVLASNHDRLKKFSPTPLAVNYTSFSVKKGENDLRRMLEQGFKLLHDTGKLEAVLNQHGLKDGFVLMPQQNYMAHR